MYGAKKYRRRAIVSFVIVGVVLVALLLAGVYMLRQQGLQTRVAQQTPREEGATNGSGTPNEEDGANKQPTELPGGSDGIENAQNSATDETARNGSYGSTADLPQTGAAGVAVAGVVLAIVAYTGARYAVSLSALRNL